MRMSRLQAGTDADDPSPRVRQGSGIWQRYPLSVSPFRLDTSPPIDGGEEPLPLGRRLPGHRGSSPPRSGGEVPSEARRRGGGQRRMRKNKTRLLGGFLAQLLPIP